MTPDYDVGTQKSNRFTVSKLDLNPKLQQGYKQMNSVSQSYVQRLEAEGKATEANKAKLGNYKESVTSLSKQLELQEKELERVASTSGKTSSAYANQSKRVNETATALAKTKTDMNSLDSAMKKANPSVFTRIKTAITGTNKEASKTPSLFKKIVAGGLVTNALSSGFSTVTSALKSTLKSGLELNEAGEKLNDTWKNMGKSANDITILGSQLGYLRSQTGATGLEVNTLQKTVDTMTKGVTDKTVVISAGIAGIATASHIGGAGMDALAKSLTRVTSSGRITNSGLARLEKQAPTLGAQLAKAAGVSQSAFAQMVDKGKISSDDFQKLLYKIGTTSGDTFKAYGKTAEGAMAQIKGGWTTLKAKMTAPLLEVKNSGMSSLAELVNSSVLQGAATSLGKAIASMAGNAEKLLEYVSAHKSDVTGISSDLFQIGKIIGNTVWSVFKQMLADIAQMFGTTTKNSKALKDPLGTVHDILDKMVKNKSAIQTFTKTLLALFAVKKATSFAFAIGQVATQLGKLGSTKLGTSVTSGVSKLLSGQSLGGLGQSIKSAGGIKGLTTAGKVGNGLAVAGGLLDAGTSIYAGTQDKKGSTKQYEDYGTGIGKALGTGIGAFFGGPIGAMIGAKIGGFIGKWGGFGAKKFMGGWDSIKGKKPKDFLGKIGYDAHKGIDGITKWWRDAQKADKKQQEKLAKQQAAQNKKSKKDWDNFWSGVGKGWSKFWSNHAKREKKNQADAKKRQDAQNKAISKAMSNFWSSVTKGWSNFWSGIGKWATKGLTNLQKGFTSKLNAIHKGWNNIWSAVGKFFSNIMNSIKKAGSSALNWLASKISSGLSSIRRTWNNVWSGIGKLFGNIWGGIKSAGSSAIGWLGGKISSSVSSISRGWSRAWHGMSKMFSGIWSGIKSAARTGLNGVIGIINGAIGGINWVWQKFTGHNAIKKIQKLASGGFVGKMQVAMVNDGAGADWKELYRLPNGQFGMMQDRNAIGMFPVGTRVYNGRETKSIMQAAGIEHYAGGGIVGSITNMFKSGWDKAKEVASWLAHPVKNVSKMLTSAVSGMSASTSMFTNLGKGIVSKLVSSVAAWFKQGLKKVSDSLDGGSNVGNPSGTSVTRWKPYVIKALKANGFSASASQVAAWMRVIQRESNGDPTAVNNWDSNAKAGIPSKGLVQTIGPTFAAYAFAGHKNILNGYDDLLAGIHYAKSRYGSGSGMFARVSGPLGYANGGFVNGAAYRLTGEAGPEMIMPLSQAKSSRAWQLLGQAVDRINGGKSNQRTDTAIDNDATTQAILDSNASILTALNSIGELLTQLSFQVTLDTDEVAQKLSPSMQKAQDALTKKQKLLSRTTYTDGGMTISD